MGQYADIVGNIGVVCFLVAYFLLQKGKVVYTSATYLILNLVGSITLLLSLLVHWNLPAFLLEASWAIISIYGMVKHLYLGAKRQEKHRAAHGGH